MAVEHQPMTIRVHHLENSRSQRILWLLEELELPYEITRYERDPATMRAPPALRQVHPLGRSPVIEDGSLVLMETGAIVEYLVEQGDGRLGPPPHRENVQRYRQFLHYAEGSIMPLLFALLIVHRLGLLGRPARRSEEHTSELQSLMRISYAVFCLKKTITTLHKIHHT